MFAKKQRWSFDNANGLAYLCIGYERREIQRIGPRHILGILRIEKVTPYDRTGHCVGESVGDARQLQRRLATRLARTSRKGQPRYGLQHDATIDRGRYCQATHVWRNEFMLRTGVTCEWEHILTFSMHWMRKNKSGKRHWNIASYQLSTLPDISYRILHIVHLWCVFAMRPPSEKKQTN